jgi:hypothetical protein
MSSVSPFRPSQPTRPVPGVQWVQLLARPIRAASFWSAVAIPFLLLGLVATGSAVQHVGLFVGLVVTNLVALRVGHAHNQD